MTDSTRWPEVSRLLDEVFELDAAARERELRRVELSDPDLAQRVRAMLRADAGSGLLESGIASVAPEMMASLAAGRGDDAGEEPDLPGRMIGRWRVIRELARGGMGQVLLAERADGEFAQLAALKRLKRGMDSDEILVRFAQERQILAGLNHPNIARLLDAGVDSDGRSFFAMEYVEGEPITEYARGNALGVRERLVLMQRVCETVAYAQGRLVVHRDLKPSNILVDARGEPRLLDFGIAKLLAAGDSTALTHTGMRVLSPAYAAPEQILGESISTATDVFSLGVLLYELLTGTLPHHRSGNVAGASAEALANETAERPSVMLRRESTDIVAGAYGRRAPERERFARELSGDLDRIVLAALRREPERRYASAAALGDDLRLFLDGRPIAARPDTSGYRLRKFLRRHKVGALATFLVVLSVLGGFGAALWQADVARRNAIQAEAQARRAEQVKNFLVSLFEASNPERAGRGNKMTALELVQQASRRVEAELGDAPQSQAELRIAIGESLAVMGEMSEGIAQIEAGVAQLRGLEGDSSRLAEGLHQLAMQYSIVGQLEDAAQVTQEALEINEHADPRDPMTVISLRTTLAKLAGLRGDLKAMEDMHRLNLKERMALVGPDSARLAVDWNNIAAVALRRDSYVEAEAAYAEAIRVIALDPESPESRMAWLRGGRGFALVGLGRYDDARVELEAAIEIARRTLHAEHTIIGNIQIGLSSLERFEGHLDAAVEQARRAQEIFAAVNHPDEALAELQLGLLRLQQRRDAEALQVLTRAESDFATRRNREEPQYWLIRVALGLARIRVGDAGGQRQIDEGLAEMKQRGYARTSLVADAYGLAASAAALRGDADARHAMLQLQHEQLRSVLGAGHPRVLQVEAEIAQLQAN